MKRLRVPLLAGLLVAAGLFFWWPREEQPARTPRGGAGPVGGWVEDVAGLWTLAPSSETDIAKLGYATGFEPAPDALGVTVHDPARAWQGLNLYSSGHAAEARLMDMQGAELHRWSFDYDDLPDAPPRNEKQNNWRRVRLLPDGSLLAVYGGRGLIKLDRDSNLLWHFPERVHHEVVVDGERILTLTRAERLVPELDAERPVIDDFIVELGLDGEVRSRLSVSACLLGTRWARLLPRAGDVLHTNSLQVLRGDAAGKNPAFAAGNLLLCSRELDLVFVIDPEEELVKWGRRGSWRGPHDPRELAGGTLLLFDNLGNAGRSRVIELEPDTGELRWEYAGVPPASFFSLFCGASARLPGGTTLITETGAGRAFEVTSDGTIVWEFSSPHRAGKKDELIAALFEVERLPLDAAPWLER